MDDIIVMVVIAAGVWLLVFGALFWGIKVVQKEINTKGPHGIDDENGGTGNGYE